MRDVHSGEELLFRCQRWLSRDEDDGEICRELAAVRNDVASLPCEIIVTLFPCHTDVLFIYK